MGWGGGEAIRAGHYFGPVHYGEEQGARCLSLGMSQALLLDESSHYQQRVHDLSVEGSCSNLEIDTVHNRETIAINLLASYYDE